MAKYDVVIVGSGLGGLQCAYILAKEGYSVCVLEKQAQYGGCLQSFKRNGVTFDTGMHYIGSMDEGQILHTYFKYFDLTGKLKLQRLDENGFDQIRYGDKEYALAMGYDRFAETLAKHFPHQSDNLHHYVNELKQQGESIGIDCLKHGVFSNAGIEKFGQSAHQFLENTISDSTLRNILLSSSMICADATDGYSLYTYAMLNSSFIESAYRIVDGGEQLANLLVANIRQFGGEVLTKHEVVQMKVGSNGVESLELSNGEHIEASYVISNAHPKRTMELLGKNDFIRKAYSSRIGSLQNSVGCFTLYLVLKPNTVKYCNYNQYFFRGPESFGGTSSEMPDKVFVSYIATSNDNNGYVDGMSILTPMRWEEVQEWEHTKVGRRGETYEQMKQRKADVILDYLTQYMPELKGAVQHCYTSTPLTYRDYTGTEQGSSYGIIKDYRYPDRTVLAPRTRIPNLFLTGQNVNLHGVLGVTLTSMLTCAELLGTEYLAKKVAVVV